MASSASSENLRKLAEAGQLKEEPTSPKEVQGLLASASQLLRDARRKENSEITRFSIVYQAGHSLALAAMRARGYRPSQSAGHRFIVFQALPHTADAPTDLWLPLSKAHKKRNTLEYDGLVIFSARDVEQLLDQVVRLDELVRDELARTYPELLKRE